jgi:hypothetical protein
MAPLRALPMEPGPDRIRSPGTGDGVRPDRGASAVAVSPEFWVTSPHMTVCARAGEQREPLYARSFSRFLVLLLRAYSDDGVIQNRFFFKKVVRDFLSDFARIAISTVGEQDLEARFSL